MDFDITTLTDYGLNVTDGLKYTGDKEKYISAVLRYMNSHESNREKLVSLLNANDIEGYKIKVHALKSNSKMIGARALSKEFEALENAASDNDIDYINLNNAKAIMIYDELVKELEPLKALGEVKPADEIDAVTALKVAEKLLEALEDFDDDKGKELAIKLSGYPFRITQKEKLSQAIKYIDDFMYDEALDIIRDIYTSIE